MGLGLFLNMQPATNRISRVHSLRSSCNIFLFFPPKQLLTTMSIIRISRLSSHSSSLCTCILQSIPPLGNRTITNVTSQIVPAISNTLSLPHRKFPLNPFLTPLFLKCVSITSTNRCYSTSTSVINCWKCAKEILPSSEFGYLLCPSCGSPQALKGDGSGCGRPTFFQLLSHPQSYSVDVERLAATAKKLQKRLHPDLFAGRGKKEQELSQELSSFINKAFSTLVNPIERGRYMLELFGVQDPIGEIEKEITNEPYFLEEVMELNEKLEEIGSEKDWRTFRTQNEVVLNQIQSELDVAFKAKKIDEAKILLARMKYFDTLQGKLKELKTKLNIVE